MVVSQFSFRLGLILAGLVIALIYWPGLSGAFLFDDGPSITSNPALALFEGTLSSLLLAAGNGVASPLGRPLSMGSFALNLYYGGADPFSFKLVNLLIHLVNGWLVFLLVRFIWLRTGKERNGCLLPACVALIWSLHPINLTTVLFVTQRMTSLAALFILLALYIYLRGRVSDKPHHRWAAIAFSFLFCWPAAILSKETGLLFPLYLLLCELYIFGLPKHNVRKVALIGLVCTVFLLVILGVFHYWEILSAGYRYREFDLEQRLLTQSRVLWFYLLQIFFPWPDFFGLYHDYFPLSFGYMQPVETIYSLVAWIFLIGCSIYFRHAWPFILFGFAWFAVSHILESTILPLELIHEHRNYLASLGPLFILLSFLVPSGEKSFMAIPRLTFITCFAIFCSLITGIRADQWGDEYRRSMLEVAVHEYSARANYQAAIVFMERASSAGALDNPLASQSINYYLNRASELDKNAKAPLIGLLYLACQTGGAPSRLNITELERRMGAARFTPGDLQVYAKLSQLLVENLLCLESDEVERLLAIALENPWLDGNAKGLILSVGMDYAFAAMKMPTLALDYAERAVAADPSNIALRINLVRMLQISGEHEMAVEAYRDIFELEVPAMLRQELMELGRSLLPTAQRSD